MPTSAKAPGSMRGSWKRSCAARPKAPPKMPPMTSEGPKSPALPPEPTVSDGRDDLGHRRGDRGARPRATRSGSHGAPMIATCAAPYPPPRMPSPCPSRPTLRADEHDDRHRDEPRARSPPSAGLHQSGNGSRADAAGRAGARRGTGDATNEMSDGEQRVERQMRWDERVLRGVREERRLAEDRDEDRVGDDAGEDRRDERVGLEVVAMEHLDGEERGAERRAEDRRHAGGRPGDQEDAALAVGQAQVLRDDRADGAADLHRRPLASARAAGAEREDRGQPLSPGRAGERSRPALWKASMIASAPPPRVSGANREIHAAAERADGGHERE